MHYMKCPNTPGPSSIILSKYNKMGIILHCNEYAYFFRKEMTMISTDKSYTTALNTNNHMHLRRREK